MTNIELQKYYQNESRFNGVYSRDNFPKKVKDGAYVINLHEHADLSTHWNALYLSNNDVIYFDSFAVEHIPQEVIHFIGNKKIETSTYRIQANNSIMCEYFCMGFIDFMLPGKTLINYTSLFSSYGFGKNDGIILSYFKIE